MMLSSQVPRSLAKAPLVEYLAKRFTYLTRDEWCARIAEGRIRCNGTVCSGRESVRGGDTVSYDVPEFTEPASDLRFRIIYEDDWILGIDKPGNLLVHRSGKAFRNNLMFQLRCVHTPQYPSANAVSRLDRETSGVMLVAKDIDTLRRMHEAFLKHAVEKLYYAVVHGVPSPARGTINLPIGKDLASSIPCRFWVNTENARDAVTGYEVQETFGTTYSAVELRPRTGRTHQLRVHMAAIGHPIAGDKVYGREAGNHAAGERQRIGDGERKTEPQNRHNCSGIDRQALHCRSLRFVHPCTNEPCEISAEPPDDMKELIRILRITKGLP